MVSLNDIKVCLLLLRPAIPIRNFPARAGLALKSLYSPTSGGPTKDRLMVDIFIRSVSRIGGPSWGYLEDDESSCPETWRTWSSLMSWIILFYPKEDTLKVSC